jgi:hypothetical protein
MSYKTPNKIPKISDRASNRSSHRASISRAYSQAAYPGSLTALSVSGAFGLSSTNGGYTYNDTPYIHALNLALQLEHAAVAIYAAKQRNSLQIQRSGATALDRTDCHYTALRQLIGLIFAQRGLPDSDPTGITALTSTVAARVSRYMPPIVNKPVLGASAQRIELALARRYRRLLDLAPPSDRMLILSLLEQVHEFSLKS